MNKVGRTALLMWALFFSISVWSHPGIGIVKDSKGNIYYTDLVHVWKLAPNGERSIAVDNVHTHELFLDSDDNLYGEHEWYEGEATDKWGNLVWCLNDEGEYSIIQGPVEGFLDNNTLVRDRSGNSFWVEKMDDYELLKIQYSCSEISIYTSHKFEDIRWMYYSEHEGNLYVIDHLTLWRVTNDGEVSKVADSFRRDSRSFNEVSDRHYLFGIWTDHRKNIYVASFGAGVIDRVNPQGEVTAVYTSPNGWSPTGGLIDKEGNMWVLEYSETNKARVRQVSVEG